MVRTPTSRVKDGVARFRMVVDESGETALTVERGELAFEPGRQGAWPGRTQRLSAERLKTARVRVLHRSQENTVLTSEAEGETRAFSGLIVSQGKVIEYDRPQLFERASQRVAEITQQRPEFFLARWKDAAEHGEPLEIHWDHGPTIQLGSITGLKQLEKLAESFEAGFELEGFSSFAAPQLIAVEGQPLQVIEVRVPDQHRREPGAPASVSGTAIPGHRVFRMKGDAELKRYTKERLKALKELDLPVDAGGH
ncbi:MAG: hypothetical protein IPN34_19340 [Planctomycetes bacterium]|nr:hypothetical protein [Planctomycetota bacterium]